MATLSDFDEIRPYADGEIKEGFNLLLADRQLKRLVRGFVPWLPWGITKSVLKLAFVGVKTPLQFQVRFMKPIVNYVLRKCSDGCTFTMPKANSWNDRYTFVSNHRDIVLDSAILDVKMYEQGAQATCEIAIGDNLLIYPWIRTLVRMNQTFTVRRGLSPRETMKSSILMSQYMHYVINVKRNNIWIAQREGRAKDSSDNTQESVLKMLALGGEGSCVEKLRHLNIVPLAISYEYDPCDYLKAKEFQQKRDNPSFKKSRQDDLDNMKIGIRGYKGHVHYQAAECINAWIDELDGLSAPDFYKALAARMDREIHANYRLYPCNYIALDRLNDSHEYAEHYTKEDCVKFDKYLKGQLAKIDLPQRDDVFLTERMLTMYANPVRNYLKATGK